MHTYQNLMSCLGLSNAAFLFWLGRGIHSYTHTHTHIRLIKGSQSTCSTLEI